MGGGKIKDATALPGDVLKEKVFYNNDGRQVGEFIPPQYEIKIYDFSIPAQTLSSVSERLSYVQSYDFAPTLEREQFASFYFIPILHVSGGTIPLGFTDDTGYTAFALCTTQLNPVSDFVPSQKEYSVKSSSRTIDVRLYISYRNGEIQIGIGTTLTDLWKPEIPVMSGRAYYI